MIEIMIAISIFALVMIAIYSTWSAVMRGSRTGMKAATEVQRMRIATRALEESIGSAVMYVDNAKFYTFATDTSGDNAYISFVARLPGSFPGSGLFGDQQMRRVCFYVEDGNLMLRQAPLLEATKKIGKPYEIALAPNVTHTAIVTVLNSRNAMRPRRSSSVTPASPACHDRTPT